MLFVAAVAFAFVNVRGTNPPSVDQPGPTTTFTSRPSAVGRIELVAGELTHGLKGSFAVSYVNDRPTSLVFGTSQDADVALLSGTQEVWRWSADRAFTQVMRTVEYLPGHHMFTLTADLVGVPPGDYTAVATLASQPAPPPARLPVRVG
jgi:hypothetical protein